MKARAPALRRCRAVSAAILILLIGDAFAGAAHANEDDANAGVSAPSRVTVKDGVTVLTLDEEAQNNAGIETAHPSAAPSHEVAAGYGSVLDAGPLTELSNLYREAKAQAQTADAKLAVSRAAFERAKTLYKDQQNVSAAQLQSAEGGFEVDRAAVAAAESHLATVAATAQQAWGTVIGSALVEDAPMIKRLIQRQDYLVKVMLPPDVRLAEPPEAASAKLSGGSEARLRFISEATTTDPQIQGASYFYVAPAENGLLPGLRVTVSLPTGQKPEGVIVPGAAVVWLEGKAWIYLRTGPQTFVRQQIAPREAAPDGGYVVGSLASNAQVVVRGAQMLLSEEFRTQVRSEEDER